MSLKPFIAKYLVIIFLAPTLILFNFNLLVFNHNFYEFEFQKLNVYENFESKTLVDTQSKNLIKYLCCKQTIDGDFFSKREKLHLADVKKLIWLSEIYFFLLTAIVLFLTFYLIVKKQTRILLFALRWGSIFTVLSIIILFLTTVIRLPAFEKSFVAFHELVFTNDLWQQPPDANLIKLFPLQFFADFTNRIAIQSILVAVVFIIISYLIKKSVSKIN